MKPFGYERAGDVSGAVLTVTGDAGAAFLAGGTNLVDHMRLGIASPERLVDVNRLPLGQIDERDGGLRIGAMVRNSDLAAHPAVRRRYPVLSQALLAGASPQLRNLATTGGNLLQRTRCVYFQDVTTPCNKRDPGSGCSAIEGWTRYHAVLGASEHCVAVHPSDMAVALAALDAIVNLSGTAGERSVPVTDLHRLPGDAPQHDTVLEHGELITSVDLPPPADDARSAYRKVRDRASYAFALVSVAAVVSVDGGRIREAAVAFGGVAHKPWRARRAEEVLVGSPADDEVFHRAGQAELEGARPLAHNAFKVPLAVRTLAAVLRELTR